MELFQARIDGAEIKNAPKNNWGRLRRRSDAGKKLSQFTRIQVSRWKWANLVKKWVKWKDNCWLREKGMKIVFLDLLEEEEEEEEEEEDINKNDLKEPEKPNKRKGRRTRRNK